VGASRLRGKQPSLSYNRGRGSDTRYAVVAVKFKITAPSGNQIAIPQMHTVSNQWCSEKKNT